MSDLQRIKEQQSVFNPADMAQKMGQGEVNPDMTIADFFQSQFGIDVNSTPIKALSGVMGDQLRKANPLNKIRNIGGQAPQAPGQPPGGMPPGGMPPGGAPMGGAPQPAMPGRKPMMPPPSEAGSMGGLINRLRR